jgi:hypothetical protein
MTGYVANPISCEAIEEFRGKLAEFHIDEDFLTTVFRILESSKFSPKSKICFLELVIEKFENDIELLDSQIQSYNFLDLKEFLENLPSPKQEEIVLPVDLQIDDDYVFKYKAEVVDAWFDFEDATDQLVIEDLEANIMHHVLIDPIADYMEVHVSLSFQTCFLYKDQKCQQLPFHIMRTHNQGILRISPTSSQVVHLFLQLLDWLHWHFCIT